MTRSERNSRLAESMLLFVLFTAFYAVVGVLTIDSGNVVVFDAMDRLSRAYMIWWNDPPKLAAAGFVFPPLTTFVYLPAAALKPLATSLMALPATTAPLAAMTIVVLNGTMRRAGMPVFMRWALVLAFGINPLFVFYGGNGMSEAVYLFFLASGISCFVGFYLTEETRYLMGAGIGLTLAMLTRYGFLAWAVLVCILVGAALARRGASGQRIEGSVIVAAVPIVYGFALWTLFNALIIGRPFGWLTASQSALAVNSNGVADSGHVEFGKLIERLVDVVVAVSPLSLVVVPLLVAAYFFKRDDMALWLAAMVGIAVVLFGSSALIEDDIGELTLRSGLPIMLMAMFGAAWLYRASNGLGIVAWGGTLILLLVSLPLTWDRMLDYPYQNQEQAFIRFVRSGDSQEGKASVGGFTVGIREEEAVAARIKGVVPDRKDWVLADNAQSFAVILLTGHPDRFFDRVDKGDERWRRALARPFGNVGFILVTSSPSDLIKIRYPRAADGGVAGLEPIFRTKRYVLLRVAPRDPRAAPRRANPAEAAP